MAGVLAPAVAARVLAARVPPSAIVINSSTPLWYLTRATGLVALVLLTASMALGLLSSVRYQRPAWPRFVTAGLHQNSSLLALAFTGIHVATTLADGYAPVRVQDVVIPFISAYRPLWLGLGAGAFDLMLALTVTSLLRTRLSYRSWRLVHWGSYLAWPVALLPGLGAGSATPARGGRAGAAGRRGPGSARGRGRCRSGSTSEGTAGSRSARAAGRATGGRATGGSAGRRAPPG